MQWEVGSSAGDSNNTIGEEEGEEKRYEVDELWILPAEGEEGAFRPRSNDCHIDNNDGDEHAKSARSFMLPKHFV